MMSNDELLLLLLLINILTTMENLDCAHRGRYWPIPFKLLASFFSTEESNRTKKNLETKKFQSNIENEIEKTN